MEWDDYLTFQVIPSSIPDSSIKWTHQNQSFIWNYSIQNLEKYVIKKTYNFSHSTNICILMNDEQDFIVLKLM